MRGIETDLPRVPGTMQPNEGFVSQAQAPFRDASSYPETETANMLAGRVTAAQH